MAVLYYMCAFHPGMLYLLSFVLHEIKLWVIFEDAHWDQDMESSAARLRNVSFTGKEEKATSSFRT